MTNHSAASADIGRELDAYGTRATRRRQVIALYGGYAPLIPLYVAGYSGIADHGKASIGLGIFFLVLFLCCAAACGYGFYSLLQQTLVNAPNMPEQQLDERWIERRNAAVLRSFRLLGMGLALAAVYAEIAFTASQWEWMRNPSLISWFLWLGALLGMTLPTAMMAWNEPDPIPREST